MSFNLGVMANESNPSSEKASRKAGLRTDLQRLDTARKNIMIAENILETFPESASEIALHLLFAWQHLSESAPTFFQNPTAAIESLPLTEEDVPRGKDVATIKQELQLLIARVQPLFSDETALPADSDVNLGLHAAVVSRVESRLRKESYGEHGFTRPLTLFLRFAGTLIVIGAVVSAAAHFLQHRPWVAFMYDNESLQGSVAESLVLPELDIDWMGGSPLDGKTTNYSVRFNSCLRLTETAQVHMRLGSDDGSRLFFNGKEVISMWAPQAMTYSDFNTDIQAGTYPVLVEYFQSGGAATVKFEISVAGKDVSASDIGDLLRPEYSEDGTATCP